MGIYLFKRKLKIIGVEEALRLSKAELTGWNILSICSRMEAPLSFPGARSTKSLYFDDVEGDCPEDGQFAARPEDIQEALEFSRGIDDGPLLIHCQMGISRSTAIAWIIIYDKLKAEPGAVRQSFEFVRKLRPILSPNPHVLRLGIKALAPKGSRKRILQQFQDCLDEINYASPVWVREDVDKNAPTRTTRQCSGFPSTKGTARRPIVSVETSIYAAAPDRLAHLVYSNILFCHTVAAPCCQGIGVHPRQNHLQRIWGAAKAIWSVGYN